jgi:DNA-binding SARP family transcriptional activator
VVSLGGRRKRAVLAILLLHLNRVVSSDRLIEELWGERPPATALQTVRVHVSQIRKVLGPDLLRTLPAGYVLELGPDQLDARRFERLLDEGRAAIAVGDAASAAALLHEGLDLWRGPALADFTFEPFAQAEIARLEDLRVSALEGRIEADLALGGNMELVGELEALIAEHPLRERFRAQLMLALYRAGRQSDALDAYRDARRLLVEELGLEPSPELRALEGALLRQDESLGLPSLSPQFIASQPSVRKTVTLVHVDLLMSAPGIGWVLGYTIAAEIGDVGRFPTPAKLISYTGLCPRVRQSGEVDRRGALSKHGPPYLRWALIEAAHNAIRCHPPYRALADRQRARLGKQRGGSVAAITIARKLAEASWWMLTRNHPFAPAGARVPLTA